MRLSHGNMPAIEKNSPIFIVGSSRSGTSLLAAMLSAHSRIACGPETQVLNKLNQTTLATILNDPKWPQRAVQGLSRVTLAGQRVIDIYKTTETELAEFLMDRQPSIAALIESITLNFANKQHKPRWAEKTPRHLLHLDTIRREFPDAKIIRIIRDPRDSALSMRKLNWTSDDYLPNLYIWNKWYEHTDPFFSTDKNSTTISYEDLVHSPQQVLSSLCNFIEERFEDNMLRTRKSGQLVSTPNEVWKKQVSKELDTNRCYRWKKELSTVENAASEHLVRKWLNKFNYTTITEQGTVLSAYQMDTQVIHRNQDFILALASHGYSIKETDSSLLDPQLTIFLTPEQVASKRQRKSVRKLLFQRAIRLKRTTVLLHQKTRIKRKEKIQIWLLSSRFYKLPISPKRLGKELERQQRSTSL